MQLLRNQFHLEQRVGDGDGGEGEVDVEDVEAAHGVRLEEGEDAVARQGHLRRHRRRRAGHNVACERDIALLHILMTCPKNFELGCVEKIA